MRGGGNADREHCPQKRVPCSPTLRPQVLRGDRIGRPICRHCLRPGRASPQSKGSRVTLVVPKLQEQARAGLLGGAARLTRRTPPSSDPRMARGVDHHRTARCAPGGQFSALAR